MSTPAQARGNVKWCSAMENSMAALQNSKYRVPIRSSNSTSGYISQRIENKDSNRYFYTSVDSSIIYNSQKWKQPRCPLTDESISKKWSIHKIIQPYKGRTGSPWSSG